MKTVKSIKQGQKMAENYWNMFGVKLFGRGREEVLNQVESWLENGMTRSWIATVNPEFVMKTTMDKNFLRLLSKTTMNVVDGIGLVWARRVVDQKKMSDKLRYSFQTGIDIVSGRYRDELAAGSDLMDDFCRLAADKGYKVFFLGGWENRAQKSAEYFSKKYKIESQKFKVKSIKSKVKSQKFKTGYCPGEPKITNEEVVKQINEFKPDILFVAYGMQRQEEWIARNLDKLNVGVIMGVGRSFDYYSGELKRAPMAWRRFGLEWLYSLIKEPKRWRRQLELPKFVWKVLVGQ